MISEPLTGFRTYRSKTEISQTLFEKKKLKDEKMSAVRRVLKPSPQVSVQECSNDDYEGDDWALFDDSIEIPYGRNQDFDFTPYRDLHRTSHVLVQMGVHTVNQPVDNPLVCVRKRLLKAGLNRLQKRRIQREVLSLVSLDHPNIVKIMGVSETFNHVNIFLEYCEMGDLHNVISSRGVLEEEVAMDYFFQTLSAVRFIHSHGLAHRDLKPENLLLANHRTVKVADFGFCTQIDAENDTPAGTLAYASPEVLAGEKYLGTELDAWSMGCVLYHMLQGRPPFVAYLDKSTPDFIRTFKNMQDLPFISPSTSLYIRDIIESLLQYYPCDRMTLKSCSESLSSSSSRGEMTSPRSNNSTSSFSLSVD